MHYMVAAVAAVVAILLLVKRAEGSQIIWQEKGGSPYQQEPSTIEKIVQEAAKKWHLDPALIKAHISVESSGDPEAVNPRDPSYGLMGITPILAQTYGYIWNYRSVSSHDIEVIKNPFNNVDIGSHFISYLHGKYDFDTATQMYNCGEQGFKNGVRVPEYLAKIKKALEAHRA